jgi:RNA polymerase sigma-70 factor (ECF subfamily)
VTRALEVYGPELLGFLFAILKNESEADEVFAQTCANIWSGVAAFNFNSSFRTWAYVIARNAYHRHKKKSGRRRETPIESSAFLPEVEDRVRTVTRPYLRTDVKARVAALREKLSPTEQTLLVLRIDRGFSWNEIAEVMTPPESKRDEPSIKRTAASCRKRFERLTARLRAIAEREGLLEGPP